MTKYNEVVPLTKEQRIKEKAGWKALKYFYEPAPPADIILARNEHIERVAALSPIQVFGESEKGFTYWVSADDLWMVEGMPAVHREVSKYEIVLDCESERTAKFVQNTLDDEKIPYRLFDSGGRGFHFHIFFELPKSNNSGSSNDGNSSDDAHDNFKRFFIGYFPTDLNLAYRHGVREIYSLNMRKGFIKYPVETVERANKTWKNAEIVHVRYPVWRPRRSIMRDFERWLEREGEEKRKREEALKKKGIKIPKRKIPLNEALEIYRKHLDIVKETPKYIRAHCPFHPPDKHPSFVVVKEGKFAGLFFEHHKEGRTVGDIHKFLRMLKGKMEEKTGSDANGSRRR